MFVFVQLNYLEHALCSTQTRFKTKVEQQKAESERLQALTKVNWHTNRLFLYHVYLWCVHVCTLQALQSSEEARIAFRFSAHLDKMHTQLLSPDTVSPFRSQHDVLARLLPYHVYAEPEPPAAAVEKGEQVTQSRGINCNTLLSLLYQ